MADMPDMVVEVAWTTPPRIRPAQADWTRIDADTLGQAPPSCLRTLTTVRGAQMRLAQIEAGEAEALIDNREGQLTPGNPASPYWPNVKLRRRIRFTARTQAGDFRVFTGFLDRLPTGWELGDGWVTIAAVDMLALLASDTITHSAFEQEILRVQPKHWWRLDDESGRTAIDHIGDRPGSYRFDHTPVDPLLPFEGGRGNEFEGPDPDAPEFEPGDRGRIVRVPSFGGGPMPFVVDAWVRLTAPPKGTPATGGAGFIWLYQIPFGEEQTLLVKADYDTDPSISGRFHFSWFDPAQTPPDDQMIIGPFSSQPSLLDGNIHHVRVVVDDTVGGSQIQVDLIVDGVAETALFPAGTRDPQFPGARMDMGYHGFAGPGDTAGKALTGHVVWWHSLTSQQVDTFRDAAPIVDAALNAFAGDLTGARINRVLDLVGIDPADRNIDPGTQHVGPAIWKGDDVLGYLARIVATEQGALFIDPDGRVTFLPRPPNDPTPTVTFAGKPDDRAFPAPVPYSDLDPPEHDPGRVINVAEVATDTPNLQPVRVEDSSGSLDELGPVSPGQIDTAARTASQQRSIGARLIIRNRDPRTVITGIQLASRRDDVPPDVSLGIEIGDPATIIATPPGPGDPLQQLSLVERIEQQLDWHEARDWRSVLGASEHIVLPTLAWDTPGRGWDESVWGDNTPQAWQAVALTPNAHLQINGIASPTSFTWCGWRRLDATTGSNQTWLYLRDVAGSGDGEISLEYVDVFDVVALVRHHTTGFESLVTGPAVAVGDWWWFAIAADVGMTGNITLYWAQVGDIDLGSGVADFGPAYDADELTIGVDPAGSLPTQGSAGHDKLWVDRVLTETELRHEMRIALPVDPTSLWAYWPGRPDGADQSGNNRDLTPNSDGGTITTTSSTFGPQE